MSEKISILYIGDIVGDAGISAAKQYVPVFKEKFGATFVIINGENSCKGKGITEVESSQLFEAGANIITTGNHVWENWKSKALLASNGNIVRPFNYPPGNPGKGFTYFKVEDDFVFAVLQIQGRTFMQTIDCPFRAADNALRMISQETRNIIVDFHAETTAEKISMGWYLDGRVSAVIGSHTHIQTSDAQILPEGAAFISDIGMTGPYDSVVGLKKDIAIKRFLYQTPYKYEVAEENVKISGVNILVDPSTGRAVKIESFVFPDLQPKSMSNIAYIKISNLWKFYKNCSDAAVSGLSLEICSGEIFGLLGPNGAGKTTTISIIATLLKASDGTVMIDNIDVGKNPNAVKKLIGLAPQEIALYSSLSARENLRFFGALQGIGAGELNRRINECLALLGLEKFADKKISTFSGGMKRRVNLIAAVLHKPSIIILDEPTVGIDVQSRLSILEYLKNLNSAGATIIYTSHNLGEAESICSRTAILDSGKLITLGTSEGLMQAHTNCRSLEDVFVKLTGRALRDE